MHTDRIMRLALEMAGLTEVPEDTQVYVPGEITKALVCIDADTGLLSIARDLGYDGVIVHHPQGDEAMLNPVSYTHLRAHETRHDLVCRLLLEKKKQNKIICLKNDN